MMVRVLPLFPRPRQGNPLLEKIAAEIGIDQPALHLCHGSNQRAISHAGFDGPALKCPRLERSHIAL